MLNLTSWNGGRVAIAIAHITIMRPVSQNAGCYINFIGGFAKVRESYAAVLAMIPGAGQ